MNHQFAAVVDYWSYIDAKKFTQHDNDVANKLNMLSTKTVMQMKNRSFHGEDPVSSIALLQDSMTTCNSCNTDESAKVQVLKHYLSIPVEIVTTARVTLSTETARSKERYQNLFSGIVNYLLKQFATDDNIAICNDDIPKFKQGSLTVTSFAQQLWTGTLRSCAFYNQKIVTDLFV